MKLHTPLIKTLNKIKIKKNKIVKKAGIRKHLSLARLGRKGRIYPNELGEKFIVKRKSNFETKEHKIYDIFINPIGKSNIKAQPSVVLEKSRRIIYISDAKIINYSKEKKVR